MHNKVTIEEPEERSEGPEWEVNALYENIEGMYQGHVYIATQDNDLIDLILGCRWARKCGRFGGKEYLFRRLPPGTKVTITVGGEEP